MQLGTLSEATDNGDILEIPMTFESYEVIETIGTGSYAVVVSVRDKCKDMKFAAKVMRRPQANSEDMRLLERELRLCETVSCPHLVSFIDIVYLDDYIILVMERSEGKDLLSFVMECPRVVAANWKNIFRQICYGVQYLHNHGFAHRDLKPENVLVDEMLNCKLCDYGLICEVKKSTLSTTKYGTLPYMSPEMIHKATYDARAADVWALGVILYVILTGCTPWRSEGDTAMGQEIRQGIRQTDQMKKEEAELVLKCCDVNPETRPTIDGIISERVISAVSAIKRNFSAPMSSGKKLSERRGQLQIVKPVIQVTKSVKCNSNLRMGSVAIMHNGVHGNPMVLARARGPVPLPKRLNNAVLPKA